ncbi:hypothetical protein ScPMuIL_006112 [Solemya velum]
MHLRYVNRKQFIKDYYNLLKKKGCISASDIRKLQEEIEEEICRRRNLGKDYLQRQILIKEKYKPLHPELYKLKEKFLDPEFLSLVRQCRDWKKLAQFDSTKILKQTTACHVYSLPVFTEQFCKEFVEEISHFEESEFPKGRPNTMNKYGVLLDELGFDEFVSRLRIEYLSHVTRVLYPDWGGDSLDSHKAFIVKYKKGEDLDLGYHYDNAEITINISLGKEFTGGSLYFGDMHTVPIEETECSEIMHTKMYGLIHRGQHMHGALPIRHGERYNFIVWMRSSKVRNQLCPMCGNKPSLEETVGYGDGFTKNEGLVDVCAVH